MPIFYGISTIAIDCLGRILSPAPSYAPAVAAENLRFAIEDHQEIIRGTDVKAAVIAVLIGGVLCASRFFSRRKFKLTVVVAPCTTRIGNCTGCGSAFAGTVISAVNSFYLSANGTRPGKPP
jgi:hypothetical protein